MSLGYVHSHTLRTKNLVMQVVREKPKTERLSGRLTFARPAPLSAVH